MKREDEATMKDVKTCGGSEGSCGCGSTTPTAGAVAAGSGKLYWRSVEELQDTEEFGEFMAREFPTSASTVLTAEDRRGFLRVMAASLALAGLGLTGCRRWPDEKIAPYAHRPAGRNPGEGVYYATSLEVMGMSQALLVRSFDGRPLKVEGNPEHPWNQGASDAWAQASVLDLYDPDRSKGVKRKGAGSSWDEFTKWAGEWLAAAKRNGGDGVAILTEATSSPTALRLRAKLKGMLPNATVVEYEAVVNDGWQRSTEAALGTAHRPMYALDESRVVVSLECDYLMEPVSGVRNMRGHAQARRIEKRDGRMMRLYAFESGVSVTGANADERVAMRSADVAVIAARLAEKIVPELAGDLGALRGAKVESSRDEATLNRIVEAAAKDLMEHKGAGLIAAGWNQPMEVHLLAMVMNEALGNVNKTVMYQPMPGTGAHSGALKMLTDSIRTGTVNTVVVIGGNPVFTASGDVKLGEALKTVSNTVRVGEYEDETSAACDWHISRAHGLESWGDGRTPDGVYCVRQPLIDPLLEGKTDVEVMSALLGEAKGAMELTQETFEGLSGGTGGEAAWRSALHDGFVRGWETKTANVSVKRQAVGQHVAALAQRWSAAKAGETEVVYAMSYQVVDGRFANNGWMQERPDPITKLTWDNAAVMNPETAKAKGLKNGDMVTLSTEGGSVELPVLVQPGQWRGTVSVAMGYGRERGGRVAGGAGVNVYPLRTSQTMTSARSVGIGATGRSMHLAITQDHHAMDTIGMKGVQDRLGSLYREADLSEYAEQRDFVKHRAHVPHRLSLFKEDLTFQDEGEGGAYAWGMAIDLNACTGCGACVVACQAENNVPVVGKDQVRRGRSMHWLRVDRYFKAGTEEQPEGYALMPVMCMHCENAPCEQVCPVAATVHDGDGLNVMVYNRCVGTRYCSNNCPYKVRRFNYFDYHRRGPLRDEPGTFLQVEPEYYRIGQAKADPLRQMQFNPDVTVRMRGIMEKCTYCIQRIETAKISAKNAWVKTEAKARHARAGYIADGTIKTACEQACPAQAIVFGDYHDPQSEVSQIEKKHARSYEMLEELNTKPRTKYLAKIRNPSVTASTKSGGHGGGGGHEAATGTAHEGGHG